MPVPTRHFFPGESTEIYIFPLGRIYGRKKTSYEKPKTCRAVAVEQAACVEAAHRARRPRHRTIITFAFIPRPSGLRVTHLVVPGEVVVEQNRLRVPDVQVARGLRGETRHHLRAAAGVSARPMEDPENEVK
eukprot:749338-Prorocentrum_minimum.AAC.2